MTLINRGALPTDGFTIIPNAWLRDPALNAKEKGLLCYIASHAEGYVLTIDQMVREMADSITSVRSGLEGLDSKGYLVRTRTRNAGGKLGPYEYRLGEAVSAGQNQSTKSTVENSTVEKPPVENVTTKKTTGEKTTQEKTKPSPSVRGTRLPADWLPDESLKAWARDNAPGVGWKHHQMFVDYWIAQPGIKGSKVDWPATWRNWMRKESERIAARPTSGGAPRTFRQMDADDRERESLIVKAMDIVLEADPSLSATQAREVVTDLLNRGKLDLNTLSTSAATGYSELDVITVESREVTGS